MKTDHRLSRRIPASGVHDHKQPQWWLAPLSPFLKHVNMRTLALLMFLGVALLNTTDGKDAQTKEPAAGISNTEVITNGRQELIEYAKQQGTDTLDLQTTPCRGAETKTSTY